jgi:UDP-N-acetylglucosamine acyltransferase
LKRAGFSAEEIRGLKMVYRLLFRSGLKQEEALRRIETECDSEHARQVVEFVRRSERGICRESRARHNGE